MDRTISSNRRRSSADRLKSPISLHGPFAGHPGLVRAVAVTTDGRTIISAGYDGTVRTWDSATGHPGHTLTGHTGAVHAVAVTADGRTIISAGYDGTVRTWDSATGHPGHTLTGHTGAVHAVAVTADGRTII